MQQTLSLGRYAIRRHLLSMLDDGSGQIDSLAATDEVLELLSDEETDSILHEAIARLIRTELQMILHQRRRTGNTFGFANGAISDDALQASARELAGRIFESVGGTVQKSILTMTRPDLLASVEQRRKTVTGHQRYIGLETELASRLPNDTIQVGDFFSDHDLDLIWWSFFTPPNYEEGGNE